MKFLKSNKGISNFIVLISSLATLAIVSFVAYTYLSKSENKEMNSETSISKDSSNELTQADGEMPEIQELREASNWETYTDVENKISFMYPSSFSLSEDKSFSTRGDYIVQLDDPSIKCNSNIVCPYIRFGLIKERFQKNYSATYEEKVMEGFLTYTSENIPNTDGIKTKNVYMILSDNSYLQFELITAGAESEKDVEPLRNTFEEIIKTVKRQ